MKKMLSLRSIMAIVAVMCLGQTWHASAQVLIKDFIPGPNTYNNINEIASIRDTIAYMSQDGDLWKSDGTCDGTVLIKDFQSGFPGKFTPVVTKVFFSANDPDNGRELWATSGTEASTYLVKDIYPGASNGNPDHLCAHHNLVYFAATTGNNGEELWRSDGTNAGTYMVIDLRPGTTGSFPANMTIFKDTLFFVATTSIGPALWKSDGTAAGTVLVKDFVPASTLGSAGGLQVAGNTLFFWANNNVNGAELWASDGSAAGTQMVKDINPGSSSGILNGTLHALGNFVYFSARDGVHGEELWRSDGTPGGTIMVKDINPLASGSNISEIIDVNNILYFDATSSGTGDELWRSDGTEPGTYIVRDIHPLPGNSSAPKYLTPMSNGFYFRATDDVHGYELWWSDGTAGNTLLVKDIWPGVKSSNPSDLARVKNEIVFIAETDISGEELWSTGPTPSGAPVEAQVSSVTHEKCNGDLIGAIDITVTGGDCPIVFQWTGPYNNKYYTEDLTGLRAGVYDLTITDAKGSTAVLNVEILQPAYLTAYYSSQTPPDCLGNLGVITIAAQGGTPPYEYLWENGVVGPTVSDIPFPGESYTVSITDANGCVFDWGVFETHAEVPFLPNYQVNHPVSCYNDLAYIFVPEGVKPNSPDGINAILYHWEAGPGGQIVSNPNQAQILVRGAATYYVTITASTSSCTVTGSVDVMGDFLPPIADAGPDEALTCSTGERMLNASASANGHAYSNLQVQWAAFDGGNIVSSPFDVSPVINRPGTYVMTVRNQYNGCSASDTVVVTSQFEGPSLSVAGNPSFCDQNEVALQAVLDTSLAVFDGWYTAGGLYSTDPLLHMPEAEGWAYVVAKASNGDGCTTEIRVDLLRNNQLSFLSLSADTLACGGVPIKVAYHYPYDDLKWVWTGPYGYYHQGENAYVYNPGFYYLELKAGSCVILDTIEVVGESSIEVRSYQITPPSCSGTPDGTIYLSEIWGASRYNVVWSNGTLGAWNGNLAPGHYWAGISSSIEFTEECYIQVDFDLPYPDTIEVSLVATPDTTGTNTGTITSTVTGAAPPPYQYYWSNGATTASITDLAPGIYTLTVTYNFDYYCTVIRSAEVLHAGCALDVVETMHQNNVCTGESVGQIAVSISNGTPPFDYEWSNGANTAALTNLASGTYRLTVTDAAGCSAELETEVVTSDTLPPVLQLAQLTRSLDATGHLTLTALDFDAGSADNCAIVNFEATPTVFGCDDLGLRIIDVTVTDAAGNVATGQTTLILQDNIPPQLSCPENIVVGFCQNVVVFNLPEVNDEACAAFDPNRMTQLEGLPSGSSFPVGLTTQLFQYTKLNGLSATCSFAVTVDPGPETIEMQTTDVLCFGDCTGSISVLVTGGAPPFMYIWSSGQWSSTITDLCPGQYEVSILDAYGCSWIFSPLVQEPSQLLLATQAVVDDTSSMGVGAISMDVAGGIPPYLFAWYLDSLQVGATQNLEGLYAGEYYCLMTDANGCTATSYLITVNNIVGTAEPAWAEGFLLIPNPASGEVQVRFSAHYKAAPQIHVLDALGKPASGAEIRQNEFGQIVLDVSNVAPGMYWVQLIASDGRASRKLVVVH